MAELETAKQTAEQQKAQEESQRATNQSIKEEGDSKSKEHNNDGVTIQTSNGFIAHSYKEAIMYMESGGNPVADNGSCYGLFQLTYDKLGGDRSVENQDRVAEQYVSSRYGSWESAYNFHIANGWY